MCRLLRRFVKRFPGEHFDPAGLYNGPQDGCRCPGLSKQALNQDRLSLLRQDFQQGPSLGSDTPPLPPLGKGGSIGNDLIHRAGETRVAASFQAPPLTHGLGCHGLERLAQRTAVVLCYLFAQINQL